MKRGLIIFLLMATGSTGQATELMPVAALYGRDADGRRPPLAAPQLRLNANLEVRSQSELKRARIYMQDIAMCTGSVALCRDALAIDLGLSPKPGQERPVEIEEIHKALAQEFPEHHISLQVPPRPRVTASAVPLDAARIREQIEQRLASLPGPFRFFLVSVRVPVGTRLRHEHYAIDFPSWNQDFSFIQQNPRRSLVNLMIRMVDQESGSTEQWDFIAQVVLRAEIQAAVLTRPLQRGQLIEPEAVAWQWIPYQENVIRDLASLEKQLIRLSARPGQILRNFDMTRDPDVKRGEKVEASVLANGVKMNSSAQAMESAAIGQRIRIQLDTTKRQVMATVTGRSQVEVHMP